MEFPPPSAGSALPLQRIAFSADGSIMAVELGEGGDSEVIQVSHARPTQRGPLTYYSP